MARPKKASKMMILERPQETPALSQETKKYRTYLVNRITQFRNHMIIKVSRLERSAAEE